MPMPADYIPICGGWYISLDALEKIREVGPQSKFHDANLIEAIVQSPLKKFLDLNRQGFKGAMCLSGAPPHRFDNDGEQLATTGSRRVFLVFSTLKNYGNVVFDWEWRPGDPKTGYPDSWEQAFGGETKNDQHIE